MDIILTPTYENKIKWSESDDNRVLVLLSGGVDSAVALLLLKEQGYNTAGLTMTISDDLSAIRNASQIAMRFNIPHFYADLRNEFKRLVMTPFIDSYKAGLTPNPCSICNASVKFGLLVSAAQKTFGDNILIASGHYAKITAKGESRYLSRASDKKKDQSYFLSGIKKELIARLVFPLGEFVSKEQTRELAEKYTIPAAKAPESMDVCFAASGNYRALLGDTQKPGPIINSKGNVIGRHAGIANYTLGQRKGLGITWPKPLYVTSIQAQKNTIVAEEREAAFSKIVLAKDLNIFMRDKLTEDTQLYAKVRSQGEPSACKILKFERGFISVEFVNPIFAPTAGQRLVIYTEDGIVVAGAVIFSV